MRGTLGLRSADVLVRRNLFVLRTAAEERAIPAVQGAERLRRSLQLSFS